MAETKKGAENKQNLNVTNLKQKDLLNYSKERIKKLLQSNIVFKNRYLQLLKERTELEKQNDALQKDGEKLIQDFATLQQEKQKFESEQEFDATKLSENLENMYSLLGFSMKDFQVVEDAAIITLQYNNHCFVKLAQNENFELLQIEPNPINFDGIKKFLYHTQDLSGFLATLRTFFKLITLQIEYQRK